MKLHANAALSSRQRERMVSRVLEHGWSLTRAAEAAEVSERTLLEVGGPLSGRGPGGLLDRSSAPAAAANRTAERRVQMIAALRRLRFTGPELAELLDLPLSRCRGY